MQKHQLIKLLVDRDAMLTNGHYVLASGRHSKVYLDKNALYPDIEVISKVCESVIELFEREDFDVIIAAATGGIVLLQWCAYHYQNDRVKKIKALYVDKCYGKLVLARGYSKFIPNKRVLIVEDIITTGGTMRQMVKIVEDLNGEVVGIAALCNRSNIGHEELGLKYKNQLRVLMNMDMTSYSEKDCPMCNKGIPINTEFGRGKNKK